MVIYAAVVFGIVTVTTILLLFIFNVRKHLGLHPLIAAGAGSLLVCFCLPYIFGLIFRTVSNGSAADFMELAPTLAALLAAYILLAAIMAFLVSSVAGRRRATTPEASPVGPDGSNFLADIFENMVADKPAVGPNAVREDDTSAIANEDAAAIANEDAAAVENEDAADIENEVASAIANYTGFPEGISGIDPYNPDIMDASPGISEKSVDSDENIDKMRIEQKTVELDNQRDLSLEECIEEAFRLKAQGDPEGAVLYYMYALDRKCDRELVFLIVLDICVLYKSLGQVELARDVLSNYVDAYGYIMSAATREEIERNLKL